MLTIMLATSERVTPSDLYFSLTLRSDVPPASDVAIIQPDRTSPFVCLAQEEGRYKTTSPYGLTENLDTSRLIPTIPAIPMEHFLNHSHIASVTAGHFNVKYDLNNLNLLPRV